MNWFAPDRTDLGALQTPAEEFTTRTKRELPSEIPNGRSFGSLLFVWTVNWAAMVQELFAFCLSQSSLPSVLVGEGFVKPVQREPVSWAIGRARIDLFVSSDNRVFTIDFADAPAEIPD